MEPSLTLRYAVRGDARVLFEWRNDPGVRRNFVNQEPVSLDRHLLWLESTLSREDRVLLIGETVEGLPVGVVRFDIDYKNARAEMSITVAPSVQGRGYAVPLLRGAIAAFVRNVEQRGEVSTLIAKVRHDNAPSLACFGRVGFKLEQEDAEFKYLSRALHTP